MNSGNPRHAPYFSGESSVNNSLTGWQSDDARRDLVDFGARHKQHIAEQERAAVAHAWDATINEPPPLAGYQIRAGGPLYEPSRPIPDEDRRFARTIIVAFVLLAIGAVGFLVWWLRGGCPWL